MKQGLKKFEKSLNEMYSFDNIKDEMMSEMTKMATGGAASKLPDMNDLHKIPPAMLEHLTNKIPNMPGLPQNLAKNLPKQNKVKNDKSETKQSEKAAKNEMARNMLEDLVSKRHGTAMKKEANEKSGKKEYMYKNEELFDLLVQITSKS